MKVIRCLFAYLWALPITAPGTVLALLAGATGGTIHCRDGVIEACGGVLGPMLRGGRWRKGGAAMALGHVILARNAECLRQSRSHELHHVRQFERWGVLLLPVYWSIAIWLRLRDLDPYLDHPFENTPAETDDLV